MHTVKVSEKLKKDFQWGLQAREHSYSPYSKFKVGAALFVKGSDVVYLGANIENASYGGCVCAERVALLKAIFDNPKAQFSHMVVVTQNSVPASPCGFCLQSMAEFCEDDFLIYLGNLKGIQEKFKLKQLLGRPFRSF